MTCRVALVVNNLNVGGLEKVVVSLLRELDPARFEVCLVCIDGDGSMFANQPLPAWRTLVLNKRPSSFGPVSFDVVALWRLANWLVSHHIDIVHAHNFAPLIYADLAARLAWRPTRGSPRVIYSEHNQINSASRSTALRFKYYVRLADRVVAVSRDLERTLHGPKVGLRSDVTVIYNGIDGDTFNAVSGEAVRKELALSPSELLVGTGVVLSEQKGIEYLVQAARQVLMQIPHATFVVAGEGPLRARLEALAAAAQLGNRFRFLGYRCDMHRVIAALDVYVLPSLWEGLPLALLEALAMNRVIVCTSVGGNPEIVRDGENGLLVPERDVGALAQALTRALTDHKLRDNAMRHNRKRFELLFSEKAMVRAHESLYLDVSKRE